MRDVGKIGELPEGGFLAEHECGWTKYGRNFRMLDAALRQHAALCRWPRTRAPRDDGDGRLF